MNKYKRNNRNSRYSKKIILRFLEKGKFFLLVLLWERFFNVNLRK